LGILSQGNATKSRFKSLFEDLDHLKADSYISHKWYHFNE